MAEAETENKLKRFRGGHRAHAQKLVKKATDLCKQFKETGELKDIKIKPR